MLRMNFIPLGFVLFPHFVIEIFKLGLKTLKVEREHQGIDNGLAVNNGFQEIKAGVEKILKLFFGDKSCVLT